MAEGEGGARNGQSGGYTYGRLIDDGQSTVTFASALTELVGRPLSSLWANRSAAADYRARLGEWAPEAVDAQGRWLQPMLQTKAFEEHLIREEGHPEPSGTCHSNLAWAQLLYALNIRPGDGVLTWKLPPKAVDPAIEPVRLLVDGVVISHIVNLFRIYESAAPAAFSADPPTRSYYASTGDLKAVDTCQFPFGTITIATDPMARIGNLTRTATFEPGSREDLGQKRIPFTYNCWYLRGTHLKFEKSSLIAKYLTGVYNQVPVVDAAGIGPLPMPKESLKVRSEYFVKASRLLDSQHQCEPNCELECYNLWDGHDPCTETCPKLCRQQGLTDWNSPRLVTKTWLEEIERVKRRVTTNQEDDEALLDFLLSSLGARSEYVLAVKTAFTESGFISSAAGDAWKSTIRSILKAGMLYSQQHILLYWTGRTKSTSKLDEQLKTLTFVELRGVLAEMETHPVDGWFSRFWTMTDEVVAMITHNAEFVNKPVIVLELDPTHPLWKSMFEIKGE